jgi:DNA processing protein
MIREGEVLLVSRAEEVVDEAGPLRLSLPGAASPGTPFGGNHLGESLRGDQASVFAALPAVGSRLPAELAADSGLPPAAVRAALAALELAGLVGSDHSGWFRVVGNGSS